MQPKLPVLSAPRSQHSSLHCTDRDMLCLFAGAQHGGEEGGAGGNAAAGLSARISEIGAENSPTDRDSTGGDVGAGGTDTVAVSDIWDD
jgi:hypothetical protein